MAWLGDDLPGLGQIGDEHIDHIPQAGGGVAHAVGDVQPALFGLDGRRALAVLGLGDGVVAAGAGDDLLVDDGVGDVLAQAKTYAAARAGVDEVVHGAGVEGVLAVDKAGQQVHVALLGAAQGDQVGQPLPGLEVPGADDAGGGHGGGQVGVGGGVKVEPPLQGDVLAGEDGVVPPVVGAVVPVGLMVLAGQQGLLQGLLAQVFGVQFRL